MKFELKDYQEQAARRVVNGLRRGSREFEEDGQHTAVSLSSPTGSGKTVIAASVIERMLFGDPDADIEPDPDTVFLWLTDDPSLNEQTRKKILEASDRIQPSQLVTITDRFDEAELAGSTVYFLNIQKLARTSTLGRRAEGRRVYPIWETIRRTIAANGARYYLVIDEAHRGTGTKVRDRTTIAQRLVSGADELVLPSPVVWGISATPQRFDDAMAVATPDRVTRKVAVPVEQVRESGLIKEILSIHHQGERQTMEATLMREAVRELRAVDAAWARYAAAEDEPPVNPVLVVQIPPSHRREQVGELLDVCREEWDLLGDDAVAHALESHAAEEYGRHVVRYVAPQDIQDHPRVRVVLFKEALTTGWDCPRAEVMVSLRKAQDDTYIAQLIGRMVRAPLARRIESDETLNRVLLYLPNFDSGAVEEVKAKLERDPEGPVSEIVLNSVEAVRNPEVPAAAFERLERLVSYAVPGPVHRSQVTRLHKLAALLSGDGLLTGAIAEADAFLAGALDAERSRLEADGALDALIHDVETATVLVTDVALHSSRAPTTTTVDLDIDAGDLDRLFKGASRRLRDGLATTYWSHRVTAHDDDPYDAKILTAALSRDARAVDKAEHEAEQRVRQWLDTYGDAIATLSEDKKAQYARVRAMAQQPEQVNPGLPSAITMANAPELPAYRRHLFADAQGRYKVELGDWEAHIVAVEQDRPGFAAWYRNPVGGQRALRIPYERDAGWGKMHPDFVFFHEDEDGRLRVSLIDPHGHHLADAAPKLRGLAAYAERHGGDYARVVAVIKTSAGHFRMLDLTEPTVREALATVITKEQIEDAFARHGAGYG